MTTAAARLAPLRARWQTLSARDRSLLLLAAAVVGVYLVVALAVQPAWRQLRAAPAQRDALDRDWQTMQRLAAESRDLRATPPLAPAQSAAALKAASDRLGDKARLIVQGDRATLTLQGAGTEQLVAWLAEVRSGARARPIEARLQRGAAGFTGSIVVATGRGAP